MKTQKEIRTNGSVLLVTLVITAVLGFALASYLTLIGAQSTSVRRSQTWNASIPLAEAGIEEAIAHLNKNCAGNFIIDATPIDWNADGWTSVANGVQKSNRLGESYYVVTIVTNAPYSTNAPAILAEGYVPAHFSSIATPGFFAALGANAVQTTAFVGRKIKVTTSSEGVMAKGLVAKDSIDLKGNGVTTDSFDSDLPGMNINGQYDATVRRANGDVAVNGSITNSAELSVQNANINGHVAVGPNGSISVGSQGAVGDLEWNAGHNGIQPGYARYDMNVDFPDVQVPFSGGATPVGGYVTNETVTAISVTNAPTSSYPAGPGMVYTNTTPVTLTSYPVAGTYIGSVITNTAYTVTPGWPAAGTYIGIVATNTVTVTSSTLPSSGSYMGSITTNTVTLTSSSYPSSFFGSVATNASWTTGSYPSAGTYLPPVQTNYNGSGKKIMSYSYNRITGYTYHQVKDYSYEQMDGYGCNKITGYTVAKIASYTLVQSTYTTNYNSQYYDYILEDGENYKVASLNGDVYVRGDASIYVTDSLNMNEMRIGKGSRVKVYMGGSSTGGNYFVNENGTADSLWYFGLPSNTSISFHGNGGFCGVIYAPQAALTLGGGGNDRTDFIGASLTKTVKMNGHFNFHYDEALERKGPRRGFVIRSWKEIGLNEN